VTDLARLITSRDSDGLRAWADSQRAELAGSDAPTYADYTDCVQPLSPGVQIMSQRVQGNITDREREWASREISEEGNR
jgi:hypothetical protein